MANHYLKASFVLTVAPDEADLIGLAFEAAELLADRPDEEEQVARHAGFGPAFADAFPVGEDDPFAGFRDLFDEPDHPTFGCSVERLGTDGDGREQLWFSGEQVGIDALPRLFCVAAPTALPFAFEFSFDCDRLRIGEFGGGIAIAEADGARWITTRALVEEVQAPAMATITAPLSVPHSA